MQNLNQAMDFEKSKGCFWQIEYEGHTGYLLGSIHFDSDHLLDPLGNIMDCFYRSKSVAVETNTRGLQLLNSIKEIQLNEINRQLSNIDPSSKAILEKNIMTLLSSLKDIIKIEDINSLPLNIFQFYKYLLTDFNQNIYDSGMEPKFISLAQERNHPVHDLENLENVIEKNKENLKKEIECFFQDGIGKTFQKITELDESKVNGFSKSIDEKLIEEQKKLKDILEKACIFENWKNGNLDYFEIYNQTGVPPGYPQESSRDDLSLEHHERLDRNEEMAKKILELILSDEVPFSIVGVRHTVGAGFAHRPGKFSVLSYLTNSGCKITRIHDF